MAEFLIKAQRHWSYKENMTLKEQVEYDKQYQIGDIVQVFPDGKLSDYAHAGGKFYVVRVKGLDFKDVLEYQKQLNDGNIMLRRRKFELRIENLPSVITNKLKTTYVYNTTWDEIKEFIANKIIDE